MSCEIEVVSPSFYMAFNSESYSIPLTIYKSSAFINVLTWGLDNIKPTSLPGHLRKPPSSNVPHLAPPAGPAPQCTGESFNLEGQNKKNICFL